MQDIVVRQGVRHPQFQYIGQQHLGAGELRGGGVQGTAREAQFINCVLVAALEQGRHTGGNLRQDERHARVRGGHTGAAGGQEEAAVGAGSNGHDVAQTGGNVDLAVAVVPPADNGAVGLERQTIVLARRNRHYVIQGLTGQRYCADRGPWSSRSRNTGTLAAVVASPANDGAVGPERQTVVSTRRNGHHIDQTGGNVGLAVTVASPAEDGAV